MKKSRLEQSFDSAVAHHQAGRIAEAETLYRQVLEKQPNHADALHLLGVLAAQIGRFEDAVKLIGRACVLSPNVSDYRAHLGNALSELKHYPEAIEAYRYALRLKPNCAISLDGMGAALRELGQIEEALASQRKGLALSPNSPAGHYNYGLTLGRKGLHDEALSYYRRAIALLPTYADAHWNLSLILLMQGHFEEGWGEYEWRWQRKNFGSLWPPFSQPTWRGEDLSGKTLLIYTEQGYGDAAQFVRYLPMLIARGAKVFLLCQPPLARMLRHADGVEQVFSAVEDLPAIDVCCPLLSLPFHFGTRLETIPANVPYLKADPSLVSQWASKVGSTSGRLKVGLAWAGSPTNKNDRYRSVALNQLAPLARAAATFYSLQKGPASAEAANPPAGMELIDFTADLQDFADTAALIAQLDLVITVDTAVAHIAGAMGKPAWVLLASEQDWRWLLNREDTPWYPTVRLFRQTTPGQWPDVIERLADALANYGKNGQLAA